MPVTDDDDYDGPVSMAATQSTASKAEQRKSNKPIMEKRRRARINHCLNELKTLILNAMKKDPARHSKLEKADILEMTVKHLQNVQRQQLASAVATDPTVITKFRSGFDECAAEVTRYISRLEGVDTGVKQRLSAHLHRCVSSLQQMAAPCPPSTASSHDDNNNSNQRALLIPSRLPTGEIALVLPNYNSFIATAPSSAFTAIKPPSDNQRSFQPFQVEIPNSQLTAHISFPEGIGRKSPAMPSPTTFDLQPQIIPEQKPQVSSTEGFDRLLLKPNIAERRDLYERTKVVEVDKGTEPMNSPAYKYQQRQIEGIERLHPTQIHQKPNPNFVLNPKLHSSPHKFIRNTDGFKGRPVDSLEPPFKKYAVSTSTEHRMSVIVSDCSDSTSAEVTINRPVQYQNEPDTSQRDMWRPW